jgi:hypothetical protein
MSRRTRWLWTAVFVVCIIVTAVGALWATEAVL